jgi:hypothetical protein
MSDADQQIHRLIETFARDLEQLVRTAAVDAVSRSLGSAHSAPPRARVSVPTSPSRAPKAARRAPGSGGKRSPAEIEATVAAVLAYVSSHPGVRSEMVREDMRLARPVVKHALDTLRAAKKVSMSGTRRGAKFTAR